MGWEVDSETGKRVFVRRYRSDGKQWVPVDESSANCYSDSDGVFDSIFGHSAEDAEIGDVITLITEA